MDHDSVDKKRSFSTLNTLYHESRQEMELLAKQLALKDNIIAELKARLAGHERTRVAVGDNQSVVVGPSKSLLESLCQEICKLKQKRNETEFKASRQAEEIQRLTTQLREKDLELESVRTGSGHEKDREIQRLRAVLGERERTDATRTVLCSSLAEEAEQLRGQLGTTVKVCRQLLARMEKNKTGEGDVEEGAKKLPESPDRCVNAQMRHLQEENQQLKQRVAYVQGLNSQWQKYDSSREDFIRGLCQRLRAGAGQAALPGLGSASGGLLHHEISRLNGSLEDKLSECARLRREMEEMRRKDRERIQTLEQQVVIYTEDFKSERADRERAQAQIQDLKEQICQLKLQLHKQGASREMPLCHVHIGHRVSSRRYRDATEHPARTNVSSQHQLAASPSAGTMAATQNPAFHTDLSDLQCPRCLATFHEDAATEYLNHCEECATL
ncbi:TNFAIP3-interacting protein 2 isoform X2 [Dunckerocampus dactyliophorus]|uniref:TNFAIP3-interacting protein 2 isoform X2 n=1 Tax=Dunckerocampus dactyliophorus TaxID=161453 RepID=UPI002405E207|nr:TNFAIP3-interacting protein 2 isoform X2 [Dunckerocampus dactyliophorus]